MNLRSARFFIVIAFVFISLGSLAYTSPKVDSLRKVIASQNVHDTVKLNAIVKLCFDLTGDDPDLVYKYGEQGLKLCRKYDMQLKSADIYVAVGTTFKNQDKLDTAEICQRTALEIYKEQKYNKGISRALNNLGIIEKQRGNYGRSLEYYFQSLEPLDKVKDKADIARVYTNIGIVYKHLKNYEKAIEYQKMCIELYSQLKDTLKIAKALSNLGVVYREQGKLDEAKEILKEALQYIVRKGGEKQSRGTLYESLGNISALQKDHHMAQDYYQKAREIYEDLGNTEMVATCLANEAKLFIEMNNFPKAKLKIDEAYKIAVNLHLFKSMLDMFKTYAQYYTAVKDYKTAYTYLEKFQKLNDSVFTSGLSMQISDMEKKLMNEKKQREIDVLKNNETLRASELKKQKLITYGLSIFVVIIIVLSFFIYKNLREKKKANILLERKNTEIASQKLIIEEKNKDIIDSIKYAERLQKTILPPMKIINEIVPDSFVFFKPKDIVSGDFYWIERTKDGILFAVIDCTGHGVPGAMMSLVGNNLLNKIVKEKGITSPQRILNELVTELFLALRQDADEIKANDGMDLTVCLFHPEQNKLTYAGAFNPVLIARNNEIVELKTDKFSIGKYAYEHKFTYKEQSFDLQKNDVVYLSTDGYSDQFGGDKGKKLMRKNFYLLLQKISHLPKEQQILKIEENFNNWKGEYEQLDDITVFGFRV
jgi:serine phosphatase RsbU (regulator of sigma subunit)